MVNFASLKQLNTSPDIRHEKSQGQFDQGLKYLARAEADQFEDIQLLVRANGCFLTALRLNRTAPPPYLGIAYVFILLKNYPMALAFIRDLLERHPEHDLALDMRQHIEDNVARVQKSLQANQGRKSEPGYLSKAEVEKPRDELDTNADIHQLEQGIQQLSEEIFKDVSPMPTLDFQLFKTYQEKCERYQENQNQFLSHLKTCSTHYDTSRLELMLQPLEHRILRLQQVIKYSQMFNNYKQKINKEMLAIDEMIRALAQVKHRSQLKQLHIRFDSLNAKQARFTQRLEYLTAEESAPELEILYQTYLLQLDILSEKMEDKEIWL